MENALVLDNGSRSLKGGVSGDELPRVVIPSLVGRTKQSAGASSSSEYYVGSTAQRRRSLLTLRHPVQYGLVKSWGDMEKLWEHTFTEELQLDPSQHPVLLTETPLNPTTDREMMSEIMFEKFQTPALCVAIQSVLAMYAAARTSGLVLDCGEGVTHSVPVYQGFTLHSSIRRLDLAGCDVTDRLVELLAIQGHNFTSPLYRDIICDMKENLGYVTPTRDLPQPFSKENNQLLAPVSPKIYTLPDGTSLTLASERHDCTEPLFSSPTSLQSTVSDSIHSLDSDLQALISSNIVLAGGTTLFPGFKSRLKSELQPLIDCPSEIITSDKQKYSSWVGGSILGSLSTFSRLCLTKAESEEYGRSFVNRRCLMEWDIDPLYGLHSISGG